MICAIVLAAGLSRRMGAQKLLLPYGGTSLIGHIVDRVIESCVCGVCVVIGRDGPQVAAALANRPISLVTNPQIGSEMLESVRCGLRALPAQCEGVLVVLGDQPGLAPAMVNEMAAAWRTSGRRIVVPTYGGKRGHPLLFSLAFRDEILTEYEDTGLRGLLQRHPGEVHELSVTSPSVLDDVDLPADYRAALRAKEQ